MSISPRSSDRLRLLAVVAVVAVTTACAYFNTFYNAQAHFTKAQRIEENRLSAARDASRSAVSQTAITEYDLAIEKCNKVIQRHSGSRWVDDALLLMGRAQFGKRDLEDALDTFLALVNLPDTNLRENALFWAGRTYYELDRNEEGRGAFERLLTEYPRSELRGQVLETQARALVEDQELDAALATYRRVVREFPDSEVRQAALFELGALYMETGHFDSAYAAYEEVARTADEFSTRLDARVLTGDALFREKRYDAALDTYLTSLDLGQELPEDERAPIEVKVGDTLTELGRLDDAIARYEAVAETYPQTAQAAEAQFQIGFIQERRHGDYLAAIEAYGLASRQGGEAAGSVFVTEAADRMKSLQKLVDQGITSSDVGSGGGEASGALSLAEQFLIQEEDTTKAVAQYRKVARDFPGDEYAARALYGLAWLAERRAAPRDSVVALHLAVLEGHPGSPQAIQSGGALTRLGLEELIPEGALDPVEAAVDSTGGSADGAGPDSLDVTAPDSMATAPLDSLATAGLDSLATVGLDSLAVQRGGLAGPDSLGAVVPDSLRPEAPLPPGTPEED